MTDRFVAEPDLGFVNEVIGLGGDSLKKCFQCATCSVVCPISPDLKPFPRKEMIAASWGLRDKLTKNLDVWLCHECGDCSTKCPRGARPGDVLSAVRSYTIQEYAPLKGVGKAVNDPKKLPLLIALPAILFAVLAFINVNFSGVMESIFGAVGLEWSHAHEGEHVLAHANFFSTWFVDMVFVPLAGLVVLAFAIGLYRFVNDIHAQALADGKTTKQNLDYMGVVKGIVAVIPMILKHDKFSECSENSDRATPHMMVLFSFIALFVVTNIFFVALYVLGAPGPYSQFNPVKILANVAGIALIIGGIMMIKNRLAKKDQSTSYKDWYLIGLVLGLGLSGMLTELTRLAGAEALTYFMYYIHLIFIFNLFAFLPFSKLAHLVYRTVALGYGNYAGRENK
ncbi:MAG: quinone-interacting membrane-bound oxidoreductase complex subunit QmoC [Thermodesulfobacteriota bacterium]|nr:quinone-interacting membrane-bound oxidoreductase complex subunit QmoC [Thermodesulfobacteriota bacterium]